MKADELLTALRDDFIEHGMDAYKQFRRMGVGLDLTEDDLKFGAGTELGHRGAMLENQRIERDQEAAKGPDGNRVAKWVGFTDSGLTEANDPSRVPTEESEAYRKHAASKQGAKNIKLKQGYPQADESTSE